MNMYFFGEEKFLEIEGEQIISIGLKEVVLNSRLEGGNRRNPSTEFV